MPAKKVQAPQTTGIDFQEVTLPTTSGPKIVSLPAAFDPSYIEYLKTGARTGRFQPPPQPGAGPIPPSGGSGGGGPMIDKAKAMQLLGRPSDRPEEPVTAGLPFGQGPSYVRIPGESDELFKKRVANTVLTSPGADEDAKRLANRILAGE